MKFFNLILIVLALLVACFVTPAPATAHHGLAFRATPLRPFVGPVAIQQRFVAVPFRQQFVQPFYQQQLIAPQQFAVPVYGQQFVAPQAIGVGGCAALYR